MQTERPVYEEIEEILRGVELPRVALVEQTSGTPPELGDIREAVREALREVELPAGSVAVGVGSRGVARIDEVTAALVEALKEAGAEPFVAPAMGSHGASSAEGPAGGPGARGGGRGSAGAAPFGVPAMGSHGASSAEGQAEVLRHLGVSEETVGCPVQATMETVLVGETPDGVPVHVDKNAYEADAIVVVNRVTPHPAFPGPARRGPTKMLAIGL